MFEVTIDGVMKEWTTLEWALRDVSTRGFATSGWTIELKRGGF
jgi:hypothetical protein